MSVDPSHSASVRLLALLQAAILVASILAPTAVFAAQTDDDPGVTSARITADEDGLQVAAEVSQPSPEPTPTATAEPTPTSEPTPVPTQKAKAEATPTATKKPKSSNAPEAQPTPEFTSEPSSVPSEAATPEPVFTIVPTLEPLADPTLPATSEPGAEPSVEPGLAPGPSTEPSVSPDLSPVPSADPLPSAQPEAAASPSSLPLRRLLRDISPAVASLDISAVANPDSLPEPGGTAAVDVQITNTSANPATLTSLLDNVEGDLEGAGSCATGVTLAAAGVYECSYQATFSGSPGSIASRVVEAELTDDVDGTTAELSATASVSISDVPSSMGVTKTASPTHVSEPGGVVTFTVRVDNSSTVDTVSIESLVDDVYGDLDGRGGCAVPQSLVAGGTYSCSFNANVSGNPGVSETDTVTVGAIDDDGSSLLETSSATVTITDVPSSIRVSKSASPTQIDEPGADVVFSVSVENTSAVDTVSITSLVDAPFGDITQVAGDIVATDCATPVELVPSGVYGCTFTAFVAGNAGQTVTDTVTGSGTDDDGSAVSDDGSASVAVRDVLPTMELVKTAVPDTYPEPGGPVVFTVSVTNTSPEPITLTSLVDDTYGNLDVPGLCDIPQVIAAGATYECSTTGPVLGDAGDRRTDIVIGIGQDDDGNQVTAEDTATVTITDVLPSIAIDKTVTPEELPEPGGSVAIRVAVTNPSVEDVVVTGLIDSIHGNLNGQGTCKTPTTVVRNGGTYVCSFSVEVSGDVGYSETDTITVSAQDNDGNPVTAEDDATVTIIDVIPTISVSKSAVPASLAEPGGDYAVEIVVTNGSAIEAITLTSLIDDPLGDLADQGDCAVPQTIPPGGTYRCSIPQSLLGNAGDSASDTVTATGEDNEGNVVDDEDGATFTITDLVPVLDVDKTATPPEVPEPGGDVTFTITIANTSPEEVTQMTIEDDVYGDLDGVGTCATPVILAPVGEPGDTYACQFTTYIANNAGELQIDIVTASGVDDEGNVVEGTDSETVTVVDAPPQFDVTKTANPTSLLEPGGVAFFTIRVENTGTEPITITSLDDAPYGDLDGVGGCSAPQTIAPGGAYICSFVGSVSGNGGETVTDTVTVTAEDDEGNIITDSDDAGVLIENVPPELTVDKAASPRNISPPGGLVTFTIVVTNDFDLRGPAALRAGR